MAQLLSFGFDWRHQPYPVAPKLSQMAFQMPLGAFIHNLNVNMENVVGAGTAAVRNVGTGNGNLLEVGAFGLGSNSNYVNTLNIQNKGCGFYNWDTVDSTDISGIPPYQMALNMKWLDGSHSFQLLAGLWHTTEFGFRRWVATSGGSFGRYRKIYSEENTTLDSNGFIKAASPIVQLYADKIELNDEAAEQDITFEKIATGHYLFKGSSGFSKQGWYIETPKDANGNVLFSVIYDTLENGDISVKTYKKKFDFETVSIVADLENPVDITEGRWIDIRLQELVKEIAIDPDSDKEPSE